MEGKVGTVGVSQHAQVLIHVFVSPPSVQTTKRAIDHDNGASVLVRGCIQIL